MALTKKSWQDHLSASFGQVDEPVRSRTGNDGLIIGGIMEGTVTAVENGDFAALHFDADQNLMVNLAGTEPVIVQIGTVNTGTIGLVSSIAAGTQNTLGTVGVLNSGSVVVTALNTVGTVGVLNAGSVVMTAGTVSTLNTVGTVGVLNNGSVVVTAGTIGDLDTVGTVGVLNSGSVVVTAGTVSTLNTVGTVGVLNAGSVVVTNGSVTLNTLISGEDQTNDVMKVEGQFLYSHFTAAATTNVKNGAGLLHAVVVNATGTAPLTIFDATGTVATSIAILKASVAEQTYIYDLKFGTALTVQSTAAWDVTTVYR